MAKPTFQKAARNFGWLLAERGVRFGLGTIVGFLVARQLGPLRLGALSYCLAVVTLLQCLAAFGLDALVRRDLLQTPERTAQIMADSVGLRLLGGFAAALALLGYLMVSPPRSSEESAIFLILSLLLWQPAWTVPELWLQAQLHARYAVIAQTAALAVAAALRLWLVHADAPLTAFAAANLVESMLAGLGLHLAARRAGLRINWFSARRESM
ncbi:MAG TPA: oligosaccharide flippase family protein, partial [Candidatus Didemnitutus sp.]|nr:oligosaccharide flippase family protein [Candidatus Didemnitutus sp.]